MYGFFDDISIYEPVIIGQILSDYTSPFGEMEIFDADGTNTYDVTVTIPDNSIIMFYQDGEIVDAVYDSENHKVTFPKILPEGKEYALEYYYPGHYNRGFNTISSNPLIYKDIEDKVKNILARMIVIAWAEATRNMLVDIQGLLRDTDFKATPNSQILKAKTDWVDQLHIKNHRDQTKLAWRVRYSSQNLGRISRW